MLGGISKRFLKEIKAGKDLVNIAAGNQSWEANKAGKGFGRYSLIFHSWDGFSTKIGSLQEGSQKHIKAGKDLAKTSRVSKAGQALVMLL